jgi:hypothetical protein
MVKDNIAIEDAQIGFRNFSGKAGQYNAEGNRNFCVFLEADLGHKLEEDGWNVRWLQPKDESEDMKPYLQVAVSYANKPPKMLLISSKGQNLLNEDTVNILDWAEIKSVDLIITPYNWTIQKGTKNEKSGVKAYIKSMYVTIAEDEFEQKYYNAPDSATDSIGGCGNCEACDGSCHHNHID